MKLKNSIIWIIIGVLGALAIFKIIVPAFSTDTNQLRIKVTGDSMEPTLKNGEIKTYIVSNSIKRYDIVYFNKENEGLIKRVYGLPGETITIKNGTVLIDGKEIKDDFQTFSSEEDKTVTLKENEYYVLGDNRTTSLDSRNFGPIQKEDIKGIIQEN